ncbi:GDP-L-fucose synthase [Candidatus Pelagibacter sp.]|nr:GDP-L-fucose synthase [Candidatus Pelagibacter sp.]
MTGHNGLVGSSLLRRLKIHGYRNIVTKTKRELDLRNQMKVSNFFKNHEIKAVINAAGKVGGILANDKYKADFIYDNITIQNNIIHSSFENKVQNLIFLGSSCIYPRDCKQPIKEKYLLTGPLEKTNEPYAIAKIAGIKMCESYNFQYKTNYKCLMPCNLYGPKDNYHYKNSHFLPALISKIHNAKIKNEKSIIIWGTGSPKRELMYVDDLADACIYFLNKKTKETLINVGSGIEKSIIEYAKFIIKRLKLNIKINKDLSQPDGTPRKIVDISIAKKYGWKSKVNFNDGLDIAYSDYKNKL